MRIRILAFLIAHAAAMLASAANAQENDLSAHARAIFDHSRASVAQIRVLLGRSNSHTSTGSGFVAGSHGVMVTNYHVVADKALEPETYRLEYVLPDGRRGPLRILAIDVVHDLAVVQSDIADAPPLKFRDAALSKGDRAFSIGYPLGQGITVTEGTYNGRSEDQYYEHFHFTGAVNPGMSGGPALDANGRVYGVNVASRRDGQLVSLMVPAKYARQLLDTAAKTEHTEADFRTLVGAQLLAHGQSLMQAVLKGRMAVEKFDEFTLPGKTGELMQCSASTNRETDKAYTIDSYGCHLPSSLYIDPRLQTGTVAFRHNVLRSVKLGTLRFASLQESRFDPRASGYDRKHHTRWACHDSVVALKGTRGKLVICSRAYKRFTGLYDVFARLATVDSSKRALHSSLNMQGVPFEAAMSFARRYIESIEWNR
ncbi:MAG TPA: serine protease [Burkholderiales bacterium]|nr:serine protease [Burkholderiales bacterium]